MEPYAILKRAIAFFLILFIIIGYMLVPLLPGNDNDANGSMHAFHLTSDSSSNFKDYTKLWGMLGGDGQTDYVPYTLVGSPSILRGIESPEKTLYIVLGVQKDYTPADVEVLKDFYNRGGKLIIADDFGYGNTFAGQFNVNFYRHTLWDTLYSRNVAFSLVYAHMDLEQYLLMLDAPTGLYIRPNDGHLAILANSSRDSYVDINDDGKVGLADILGPVPVVAMYTEKGTEGAIVFVSDPGLFNDDKIFNDGLTERSTKDRTPANNSLFIKALVRKLLPTGGTIVFDESCHASNKVLRPFFGTLETITIMTSSPRELGLAVAGIILIAVMVVAKAKDKKSWIHKYDIEKISMNPDLPQRRNEIRDRLRATTLRKLRMNKGLTTEELQSMTDTQLASVIKDRALNELVLNRERDFTDAELQRLMEDLRHWQK